MDLNIFTIPVLKHIYADRKISLPEGTGKNGRILKKDLINGLKKHYKPIGKKFLNYMTPDLVQFTLLKLKIIDIFNFCATSKEINRKVCTKKFWRQVAVQKLKVKQKGTYNTWRNLVVDIPYEPNDLYSFGQKNKHKIIDKKIIKVTPNEKLMGEPIDIRKLIIDEIVDEVADRINDYITEGSSLDEIIEDTDATEWSYPEVYYSIFDSMIIFDPIIEKEDDYIKIDYSDLGITPDIINNAIDEHISNI